eukprot:gene180-176_t
MSALEKLRQRGGDDGPIIMEVDDDEPSSGSGARPSRPSAGSVPAARSSSTDGEHSKWQVLYPNYLDKKKKIPEGRRVGLEVAVENPRVTEMAEVCKQLNIPAKVENKAYPRDWMVPGRLRVLLKLPDGSCPHAEIKTKRQLLQKMGELILALPHRKNPPAKKAADGDKAAEGSGDKAAASGSGGAAAKANPAASNAKKKKGKKK